jgi:hypothetical protein
MLLPGSSPLASKKPLRILSGSPHRREYTELLHHAQSIEEMPSLGYLAAREPVNSERSEGHLLARWRDAHELSAMSASEGQARRHLVAFCHLIFNRLLQIGESLEEGTAELFKLFPVLHSLVGLVIDKIGSQNLLSSIEIAPEGQIVRASRREIV